MDTTAAELRALAQEIALDTDNDRCIPGVEDVLRNKDGIHDAQYYLHGFLCAYIKDNVISDAKLVAYYKVLALPEEDAKYFANKYGS